MLPEKSIQGVLWMGGKLSLVQFTNLYSLAFPSIMHT